MGLVPMRAGRDQARAGPRPLRVCAVPGLPARPADHQGVPAHVYVLAVSSRNCCAVICREPKRQTFDANFIALSSTVCNGCIRSYFTWDNNKCPTCATALGVRPWNLLMYGGGSVSKGVAKASISLFNWICFRPDPAMQELARKLLPDYTAKEKAEGELASFPWCACG